MDYDTFKRAAIRGQDEIVECPYNASHLISRSKMQYHLVKCARQHAAVELETCPFNATHRIPKPEFQCHVAECPDRKVIEAHKYQTEDEMPTNQAKKPDFIKPTLPPSEENWDDDRKPTYEPDKHVSNKLVFRNLQGATKSERKQFRMEERRRVNQIPSDEIQHKTPPADVPLRPPKSLPKGMKTLELGSKLGMGRGLPNCKLASGEGKADAVKLHGASSYDPAGAAGCSDPGTSRGAIPRSNSAAGKGKAGRSARGKCRGAMQACDPGAGPSRAECSNAGKGRGAVRRYTSPESSD